MIKDRSVLMKNTAAKTTGTGGKDAGQGRGPTTRLPRGERRAQLLSCAVSATARLGIARVGHAQVAEIAGISVPSVFRYFPTREALVNAVLGQVERKFLTLARRSHRAKIPVREAMHEQARGFMDIARNEPEYAHIWLEWSGTLRDDVWPRFIKLEKELAKIIADNIEAQEESIGELTAFEAALAFNGVAHVLIHMLSSPVELSGDPERLARHVIDSLLRFESTPDMTPHEEKQN
jgi:TetR/AcrR family transcriptional regulator, hemagglutinin/protease regulatory protein